MRRYFWMRTALEPNVSTRADESMRRLWVGVLTLVLYQIQRLKAQSSDSFTVDVDRTNDSTCARSVRVCPHVCCQVYSAASLLGAKSQSITSSGIPQGPSPGTGPHQPATTRTHVPSRAMCRVASLPTVIRSCTHIYCGYRPTTSSTHVATHVISHNDTAQSEGNPYCP